MILNKLKNIKDICIKEHSEKELWPSYFNRRYLEFLSYYDTFPKKHFDNVLELGCGIGYNTAFISQLAAHVVATDMELIDPLTHSPGLEITRKFLKELNINNVEVKHASAESLPFADNTFDMVISIHVLEHVPDREKAIKEINRVLKKDGVNFCVVPTRTDRIYAFFTNYIYIIKRTFYHLLIKPLKKTAQKNLTESSPENNIITNSNSFLKSFPFPPTHGAFKNYMSEVKNWSFYRWTKLISNNGKHELLSTSSSQIFPFLPLLGSVFPTIAVLSYRLTSKIEFFLGKIPFLKTFGISAIVITKKN